MIVEQQNSPYSFSSRAEIMVNEADQLTSSPRDTILLLCKSGLRFHSEVTVDGLLGITVDGGQVFLVKISEVIANFANHLDDELSSCESDDGLDNSMNQSIVAKDNTRDWSRSPKNQLTATGLTKELETGFQQ